MTLNEIKKRLYKQKPKASLANIDKDRMAYFTIVAGDENLADEIVYFEIPLGEIENGLFTSQMNAQHLIRWIVKKEEIKEITCPICEGSGEVQQTDIDYDDCRRCDGKGKITRNE